MQGLKTFTLTDTNLLLELIFERIDEIETKRASNFSVQAKQKSWQRISEIF